MFCIICAKEFLPFSNLSNEDFIHTLKGKNIKFIHVAKKKISNETEFFNEINSETDMFENLLKYVTPNELNQFAKKQENFNFFYLNISSLPYHFTEFHNLLASTDFKFDVIRITESKLNRNKKHLANIDLPYYSIEHSPADGANGGTLLYIKKDLIYKS